MENLDLRHHYSWLTRSISNSSFKIPVWVQKRMKKNDIGLTEFYHVLRLGKPIEVTEDYQGLSFQIYGRDCNGEKITIWGWFDPMSCVLEITDLAKE